MKLTPSGITLLVLALAVIGILSVLWPGLGDDEPWSTRKPRFERAAEEALILVDAIGQYARFKGRPLRSLEALIPDHIHGIPDPGLPGCGRFKYLYFGSGSISVIWYDLGLRSKEPMAFTSSAGDGDPRHAILVMALNEDEKVIDARFERMPEESESRDFDAGRWKNGVDRMQMALQLADSVELGGMTRAALQELLGPPDGERILRDTPWELRVICPRGLNERELFFYWPTETYPEHIYGGTTERVGRWVYVHKN